MYGSKFEEQLQLEALAKNEAEEHTRKAMENLKHAEEAGQGKLAGRFAEMSYETCRQNIHAMVEQVASNNKRGVKSAWELLVKELQKQ